MQGSRTKCAPCRNGTFLAFDNSAKKCKSCTPCDARVQSQIEVGACTTSRDRTCGCPSGMFRYYFEPATFQCKTCTVCEETGIRIPCKRETDAVCRCKPGFFHNEEKCYPCDSCKNRTQCLSCPDVPVDEFRILGMVSCSLVILMGIGITIYCLCKKKHICILRSWQRVQTSTLYNPAETTTEVGTAPDFMNPIQEEGTIPPSKITDPHRVNKLPDCVQSVGSTPLPDNQGVTYAIVDMVPAFRWREFVRRLGLADVAIERAELEAAPRYREAQYLMLRDWRQQQGQQGASMEKVYAALRSMDLTHCAEQLQEALCTGV